MAMNLREKAREMREIESRHMAFVRSMLRDVVHGTAEHNLPMLLSTRRSCLQK